jgi:hypothetical protein
MHAEDAMIYLSSQYQAAARASPAATHGHCRWRWVLVGIVVLTVIIAIVSQGGRERDRLHHAAAPSATPAAGRIRSSEGAIRTHQLRVPLLKPGVVPNYTSIAGLDWTGRVHESAQAVRHDGDLSEIGEQCLAQHASVRLAELNHREKLLSLLS